MNNLKPCNVIKIDKYTGKVERPILILRNKNFDELGAITNYENWHFEFHGNSINQISFSVSKYVNEVKCPYWDEIKDLRVIDVRSQDAEIGYGQFQIKVDYADSEQTIKTITGESLEVELGQVLLRDLHINDEEDMSYTIDEAPEKFKDGVFLPVTLKRDDTDYLNRSLLDLVLKDKACHWSWDTSDMTKYVVREKGGEAEAVNLFQRTYTVDETSIYDFLTGEVASDANVIFTFDTYNRKISMKSLYEDDKNDLAKVVGEDTEVLLSKNKLAESISIQSNSDSVKNSFYVKGGDDIITNYVAGANMNGSNYIFCFSDFQLKDMSNELQTALLDYQEMIDNPFNKEEFEEAFKNVVASKKQILYLTSEKMPSIDPTTVASTSQKEWETCKSDVGTIAKGDHKVGVHSLSGYTTDRHTSVDSMVKSLLQTYISSGYKIKILEEKINDVKYPTYEPIKNGSGETIKGIWKGYFQIQSLKDENDIYPSLTQIKEDTSRYLLTMEVEEDNEDASYYTETRLKIAMEQADMCEVAKKMMELKKNKDINNESDFWKIIKGMYDYFNQFSYNRLKGFRDGIDACISVLCEMNSEDDITSTKLYEQYARTLEMFDGNEDGLFLFDGYNYTFALIPKIEKQIKEEENKLESRTKVLQAIQDSMNFKSFLDKRNATLSGRKVTLYEEYLANLREDTYSNDNYISDNCSSVDDMMNKAKELVDDAMMELRKACVLQRQISTSTKNLFLLEEFETLWDKFNIFNYIRVKTDDELFKLRITDVVWDEASPDSLDVTFSENVESLGMLEDDINDVQSILDKASTIATSYSYTAKQAEKGSSVKNDFDLMREEGLNTTNMMLKNSDSNEVTYGQHGILCKRLDDVGKYGDKQMRIIGNGMYLTDDAWKHLRMAVGEMFYRDPIRSAKEGSNYKGEWVYGVNADVLVGDLIVGKNLVITNASSGKESTVQIDGDGITITNGKIKFKNTSEGKGVSFVDSNNKELFDSLNEIVSDGYLTPSDKKRVYDIWKDIESTHNDLMKTCNDNGLNKISEEGYIIKTLLELVPQNAKRYTLSPQDKRKINTYWSRLEAMKNDLIQKIESDESMLLSDNIAYKCFKDGCLMLENNQAFFCNDKTTFTYEMSSDIYNNMKDGDFVFGIMDERLYQEGGLTYKDLQFKVKHSLESTSYGNVGLGAFCELREYLFGNQVYNRPPQSQPICCQGILSDNENAGTLIDVDFYKHYLYQYYGIVSVLREAVNKYLPTLKFYEGVDYSVRCYDGDGFWAGKVFDYDKTLFSYNVSNDFLKTVNTDLYNVVVDMHNGIAYDFSTDYNWSEYELYFSKNHSMTRYGNNGVSAYKELYYYLFSNEFSTSSNKLAQGILHDMDKTSEIDTSFYNHYFSRYYGAESSLKIAISKKDVENSENFAKDVAQDIAQEKAEAEANKFRGEVKNVLFGEDDPTVVMDTDSIISPKIGGGYLYLLGKDSNDKLSEVEINPKGITATAWDGETKHTSNNTNHDVMRIRHDGVDVFRVSKDGSLKITGEINANSGYIGKSKDEGWEITSDGIKKDFINKNTNEKIGEMLLTPSRGFYTKSGINFTRLVGGYLYLGREIDGTDQDFGRYDQGIVTYSKVRQQYNDPDGADAPPKTYKGLGIVSQQDGENQYVAIAHNSNSTSVLDYVCYSEYSNGGYSVEHVFNGDCVTLRSCDLFMNTNDIRGISATKPDGWDVWRIHGGVWSSSGTVLHNRGFFSIDVGDDGDEDILFRKYKGSPWLASATVLAEAYILDKDNNTRLPGNLYVKNTLISTSDKNSKHNIESISDKYENMYMDLEPVSYMFNDGDRVHTGFISQQVEESMANNGISNMEFGAFCKDVNDDGTESYALRYGEFIALNTHMIQKAYKIIERQQREIDELKKSIKK